MSKFLTAAFILMLCAYSATVRAQPDFSEDLYYTSPVTFEIGTSLGAMNCLTDLGGKKGIGKNFIGDLNLQNSQFCGSVYGTTFYKNALGLRTEVTWGVVKASDNVLSSVKETTLGRYERNLNFRSTIFEVMVAGEIHPLYLKQYPENHPLPRLSPYIMGGIGFFVFNPRTKLDGVWTYLQPLHTEGQGFAEYPDRKPYKLKQFNFPAGVGFRYKLVPNVNFSAEFVYRFLNTDYLDDVSTTYIDKSLFQKYLDPSFVSQAERLYDRQKEIDPNHTTVVGDIRGNPKKNDSYFSLNFKIGVVF